MPVIWKQGKIRISVNPPPKEHHTRAHIHVERAEKSCSIAIDNGEILANGKGKEGFSRKELNALVEIVEDNRIDFQNEWETYHGKAK